ncbi:MAG: hypothetical protein GC160_04910 [Acidobacteria bacterium]|nr:hypothetical protein [Acidobacteriota bacterium]
MRFFLFWLAASAASLPAQTLIQTDKELIDFFRLKSAPGVYQLSARTFSKPGTATFGADGGNLSGTAEEPIVIRGAGVGVTIIECPQVCYFAANENVVFEDLTIHGAINSDHLRNWTFRRVAFTDVATPGGPKPTFGGQGGAIVFKTAGGGSGGGPLRFEDCLFSPADLPNRDTTLDFVGVQGVAIVDSVFERCNRACLQAKGGSGVEIPYTFENNLILDGGERGVFVGGATDRGLFAPPIETAQHEFGGATIRNNVIIGGKACFAASTFGGPILFENNLCYGQSLFLWRMLLESGEAEIARSGNITFRRNIFAAFTGENEFAFNYSVAASDRGHFDWPSIRFENNAFERDPQAGSYWPAVTIADDNHFGMDLGMVLEDGVPHATAPLILDSGIGPSGYFGKPKLAAGGVLNAASFRGGVLAPDQIISIFGAGFANQVFAATTTPLPLELGGVKAVLLDAFGFSLQLPLLAVAPGQINAVIPTGAAAGKGLLQVLVPGEDAVAAEVELATIAPGLFAANAGGQGVAAAAAVRIGADGSESSVGVFQGAGPVVGAPIDLGPGGEQVVLLLFGTGLRRAHVVEATIGGVAATVAGFAAQPEFVGLDQINVILPRELAGRGEVDVAVTVDGEPLNVVTITIL